MKNYISILVIAFLVISCNSKIKDSESKIKIENGTEIIEQNTIKEEKKQITYLKTRSKLILIMRRF